YTSLPLYVLEFFVVPAPTAPKALPRACPSHPHLDAARPGVIMRKPGAAFQSGAAQSRRADLMRNGAKKPVGAYCRVSTLEQKRRGYGIDIQTRDLTLFAERQGLFIRC